MTWYSPTHTPTTLDAYILKRGSIYPQFFFAERLAENAKGRRPTEKKRF